MAIFKYISVNALLTFLNVVIRFFIITYLTHIYPRADLVIFTIINDSLTLTIFCATGFEDALVRMLNHVKKREPVVRGMLIATGILWLLQACLLLPYLQYFYMPSHLPHYDYSLLQIELLLLSMALAQALTHIATAYRIYAIVSIADFVRSIIYFFIFLLIFKFIPLSSGHQYLMTSVIAATFLYCLWVYYFLTKHSPECRFTHLLRQSWKNIAEIKLFSKYSVLSSAEYMFTTSYLYIASFVILAYGSTDDVANFQIVARPIYFALLVIVSYPVFRFMLPEYAMLMANKDWLSIRQIRKRFIQLLFYFSLMGVAGCWLTSGYVVRIFFPSQYQAAAIMIDVLIIAIPFVVYTSAAFAIIKASGSFSHPLIIRIGGTLAFIIAATIFHHFSNSALAIISAILFSVITMYLHTLWIERKILQAAPA